MTMALVPLRAFFVAVSGGRRPNTRRIPMRYHGGALVALFEVGRILIIGNQPTKEARLSAVSFAGPDRISPGPASSRSHHRETCDTDKIRRQPRTHLVSQVRP
ncbi:hypothetical protein C8J56DRAFT_893697 [Mycena floridula]|nr:hypothetical protein C8J56DRAFT_893697 [Mycena floridula]